MFVLAIKTTYMKNETLKIAPVTEKALQFDGEAGKLVSVNKAIDALILAYQSNDISFDNMAETVVNMAKTRMKRNNVSF